MQSLPLKVSALMGSCGQGRVVRVRVLGISGTPRKGGNSEILLEYALEPFKEKGWDIAKFFISDKSVSPCRGCDGCIDLGRCVIDDDMSELYQAYTTCNAVIVSCPAYYRNVTAQMKAIIDRTYAVGSAKPLEGKVGGAIAVGRGQDGGQSIALTIIYNFFLSSGMICVPGELNGVTASANRPGDILSQPIRLNQARMLGENVLRYTERLR
jgi:multimeric flavodoxin WrbA